MITGAGRVLGLAYARLLAERGATVVVNDAGVARGGSGGDPSLAAAAAASIVEAGGEAVASGDDLPAIAGCEALIDQASRRFNRIDILIGLPHAGTGNILAGTGLREPGELDGDQLDARAGTLIALERERGPLVPTTPQTFEPSGDGDLNGTGSLEPDGVYGRPLEDLTRFEGNYTFHAKATCGEVCTGTREATWTLYVPVGIDRDRTEVTMQPTATLPDGHQCLRMTFTPRDRYGNQLGPGRLDAPRERLHRHRRAAG